MPELTVQVHFLHINPLSSSECVMLYILDTDGRAPTPPTVFV